MSAVGEVMLALANRLRGAESLSYVKAVFLGQRESITAFPVIVLEPAKVREEEDVYNRAEVFLDVLVMGFVNVANKDEQIVGMGRVVGVLDLLDDVKKAIDEDRTLGGRVIHCFIGETRLGVVEYPVRGFELDVSIRFRQRVGDRS